MTSLRFILLGGFLGAGKTTAMARLAKAYMAQGKRVGIVTNDQAADLVDTHSLREQGLSVEEVAGACFCCKFNDLMDKIGTLEEAERPDVILAEPVGSCTDLVATVVQPLKDLYGERFTIAPYAVLFKPSHGLKILRNEKSGFSPKAAYIFNKQLEEADAILINRADELTADQSAELTRLVEQRFPGIPIYCVSAKNGVGFDDVLQLLDQTGAFGRRILEIDYDTYAEGEAELGWLNSSVRVQASKPFALDEFLLRIVNDLQQRLGAEGAEVAHLKAIGLWEGFFGVANLVSSQGNAELSLPSRCNVQETDIIVNARVAIDPDLLRSLVNEVVTSACDSVQASMSEQQTQSFRPGRPTPTHRYSLAK